MKRWNAVAMLLLAGYACSPERGPETGSESHFLIGCTGGCGELECICGVCTRTCESQSACRTLGSNVLCIQVADREPGALCPDTQTAAFCDLPCIENAQCAAEGFFCREGYCREDPLHLAGEAFAGFGVLCAQPNVECSTAQAPPSLVGSYAGEGRVVLSSNPLWNAGDTDPFSVEITGQANGSLSGTMDLSAFDLSVTGAVIRGEGGTFSVYGTDSVEYEGCLMEARVVISGMLDGAAVPPTITGGLALRFTGNFGGDGCTDEQRATYPGTGANFEHVETRL